jgi:hypothetical protein
MADKYNFRGGRGRVQRSKLRIDDHALVSKAVEKLENRVNRVQTILKMYNEDEGRIPTPSPMSGANWYKNVETIKNQLGSHSSVTSKSIGMSAASDETITSKHTQCTSDKYLKHIYSNKYVCRPLTVCARGSVEKKNPTRTADRVCAAVAQHQAPQSIPRVRVKVSPHVKYEHLRSKMTSHKQGTVPDLADTYGKWKPTHAHLHPLPQKAHTFSTDGGVLVRYNSDHGH